jgi:hypothetical protein
VVRYFQAWIEGGSGETHDEEDEDDGFGSADGEDSSDSESDGSEHDGVEDTIFTKSFVESQKRFRGDVESLGVACADGGVAKDGNSEIAQVISSDGEGKHTAAETVGVAKATVEGGVVGGDMAVGANRRPSTDGVEKSAQAVVLSKVDSWSSGYSSSDGAAGEMRRVIYTLNPRPSTLN